jgi:type I restriction enzyme R subunit
LLRQDRETTLEVFGRYIHTYKFGEAVQDGVVLDLVYEARDIAQSVTSQTKIDAWFDAKTKGLNDWQKAALREQWGTMQRVLSSRSRMERLVEDIVFDFAVKPRLSSLRGNAMLVASSIYEACKYYELFQKTVFNGKCALVTSYNPQARDITLEDTGANTETEKEYIYNSYVELLKGVEPKANKTKTETYEDAAKEMFKKQPANMRLLIVVNKLLVGYDAPPCTYLYIDKSMMDHGLFQAICRTNRLDGEDKDFGYIVDYKDLFKNLVNEKGTGALQVYSSELDDSAGGTDPMVLMQDRLKKGRERLNETLEAMEMLCEPVLPPKGELEHIHYFCGNTEIPEDLTSHEPQRVALYKSAAAVVRAYANISDDFMSAGYSETQIMQIKKDVDRYVKLREIIRKASGESIDLKAYEADMRHLIDTYIEADPAQKISPFDDVPLLDLIVKSGVAEAINSLPKGLRASKEAVAETIANNVRVKIIREQLNDPAFYQSMSALLDEIIAHLRAKRIDYAEYLKRIAELAKKVQAGQADDTPVKLDTPGKRAIYNNLSNSGKAEEAKERKGRYDLAEDPVLALALDVDQKIKQVRPDSWRGIDTRERVIKQAMFEILGDVDEVERLFPIIKAQREY